MKPMERRHFVALLAGLLVVPWSGAKPSWAALDCPHVASRVKKIVIYHLGVDAEMVTKNASFIDDLGADSLDTIELVMAFEEEFGIEITDAAAEKMLTVGDVVVYIDETCNGTAPAESAAGGTHRKIAPCPPDEN